MIRFMFTVFVVASVSSYAEANLKKITCWHSICPKVWGAECEKESAEGEIEHVRGAAAYTLYKNLDVEAHPSEEHVFGVCPFLPIAPETRVKEKFFE